MLPEEGVELFKNNYFTEMYSGSEAGSYLRLVDFVYHSTLGLRVRKKEEKVDGFAIVLATSESILLLRPTGVPRS